MTWYALDDIGDAIDATRDLVTPFEWWTWLRLGIVVTLLGGAGGGLGQFSNVFQFGGGGDFEVSGLVAPLVGDPAGAVVPALAQVEPVDVDVEAFVDPIMVFVVAVVLFGVLALVLLGAIGTAMEFVLVQTLRHERVQVGADFGANYTNGLRLVLFRYALWLVVAAIVGWMVVSRLGTDPNAWTEAAVLDALVPLLLVGIPLFLLVSVVNGFTNVFVVPIMLVEDRSLLSAWRRFAGVFASNLGQFLLYLVVSVLLGILVTVVLAFAMIFAFIAVGIPVGLITVALWLLLSGPALWILGGTVVFLGFVALALAGMFITVPLVVFLRYYALFVLGDVAASLDPIPDVRSSVRGEADVPPA